MVDEDNLLDWDRSQLHCGGHGVFTQTVCMARSRECPDCDQLCHMATAEGEDALWRGAGRRDVQCFVSEAKQKRQAKHEHYLWFFVFSQTHDTTSTLSLRAHPGCLRPHVQFAGTPFVRGTGHPAIVQVLDGGERRCRHLTRGHNRHGLTSSGRTSRPSSTGLEVELAGREPPGSGVRVDVVGVGVALGREIGENSEPRLEGRLAGRLADRAIAPLGLGLGSAVGLLRGGGVRILVLQLLAVLDGVATLLAVTAVQAEQVGTHDDPVRTRRILHEVACVFRLWLSGVMANLAEGSPSGGTSSIASRHLFFSVAPVGKGSAVSIFCKTLYKYGHHQKIDIRALVLDMVTVRQ